MVRNRILSGKRNQMNRFSLNSVSICDAEFAVYGFWNGGVGVISWHTDEFTAHRNAKKVREEGGSVKVLPTPGGKIPEDIPTPLQLAGWE